MKAKKVFEKFTEDSDPIKDMGIGIVNILKKYSKSYSDGVESFMKLVIRHIPEILGTENIPEDILTDPDHFIREKYAIKIRKWAINLFRDHNISYTGTFPHVALKKELKKLGFSDKKE